MDIQSYAEAFKAPHQKTNSAPSSYADAFAQPSGQVEGPPAQSYAEAFGVKSQSQNTPVNTGDPWEDFKQTAIQMVQKQGLPKALIPVMLGQAANESARGKSAPGNNYFGIKGQGNAGSQNLATKEYGNSGYYGENSNFGAYSTPSDSIQSYLDLVTNYPGVKEAMQSNDPIKILQAIEANGYATSPTYVQNVAATPEFQQYATMEGGGN